MKPPSLGDRMRNKTLATAERNQRARVFGVGALKAFASNYHSLGVASYTQAGEKMLSVGAFGMVFVMN